MPRNIPNFIQTRFSGDKILEFSILKIKNTIATNKK